MQTVYNIDSQIAQVGMIADGTMVKEEESFECSEAIPFGRAVELHTDGKLRLPQGTGQAIANLRGIAIYDATKEPDLVGGGYKIGERVRVLRKGHIYAEFSGTTDLAGANANIFHSSTVATNRGKLTDSAGAGGAGVEVADAQPMKFLRALNASQAGLCLVECNYP